VGRLAGREMVGTGPPVERVRIIRRADLSWCLCTRFWPVGRRATPDCPAPARGFGAEPPVPTHSGRSSRLWPVARADP